MTQALARILLTLALAGLCGAAHPSPGWNVEHFTADNGLPQNSVKGLYLDGVGYLWIATEDGLMRYDGGAFLRLIPPDQRPGSGAERIVQIIPTCTGDVYVRLGNTDLYAITGHNRLTSPGPGSRAPLTLRGSAPSLNMLLAGQRLRNMLPLAHFLEEPLVVPISTERYAIADLFGGVRFLDDAPAATDVRVSNGPLQLMGIGDRVLALDSTGNLFTCGPDGRSVRCTPAGNGVDALLRAHQRRLFWHLGDEQAALLLDGRLSMLWWDGGRPHVDTLGIEAPATRPLLDILIWDQGATAAIGTASEGLYLYRRTYFKTVRPASGTAAVSELFYAQAPWGADSIVAVDHAGQLHVFGPEGGSRMLPSFHAPLPCLHTRDDGSLLFSKDYRLMELPLGTAKPHVVLTAPTVIDHFLVDGPRTWISAVGEFGCMVAGHYQRLRQWKGSGHPGAVSTMARDPSGAVWFAHSTGLCRVRPEQMTNVVSVPELEGLIVRSAQVVGPYLIACTDGAGLFVVRDMHAVPLPLDANGSLRHAHAVLLDRHDNAWISSNEGIFRTTLSDITGFLRDPAHPVNYAHYSRGAGMASTELNGGCDPPFVRLPNGTVSFPSMDGLVWFRPELVPDPSAQGTPIFDRALIGEQDLPLASRIELPKQANEFAVMFSMPYWGDGENLRLEYRISGIKDDWTPLPPTQRTLTFLAPRAGEHEILIRPVGPGNGPEHTARLTFSVPYPFFRTLPGMALILVCIAVLFALGIIYNAHRLRTRNLVLEQAVAQRTQELQNANAALYRSMQEKERLVSIISHDIVSPLRFIARVARRPRHNEAVGTAEAALQDIASTSEKLHASAQVMLNWIKHQEQGITIKPRFMIMHVLVADVLALLYEQAVQNHTVLLDHVPLDDSFRTDREVLSTILYNLVNNAISHAMATQVVISGCDKGDHYELKVWDDGKGLGPEARDKLVRLVGGEALEGPREGGLGYVIIRDMLKLLGGRLTIESAPAMGTTITLCLPVLPPAERR